MKIMTGLALGFLGLSLSSCSDHSIGGVSSASATQGASVCIITHGASDDDQSGSHTSGIRAGCSDPADSAYFVLNSDRIGHNETSAEIEQEAAKSAAFLKTFLDKGYELKGTYSGGYGWTLVRTQ